MSRSIFSLALLAALVGCTTTSASISSSSSSSSADALTQLDGQGHPAPTWLALLDEGGAELGAGELEVASAGPAAELPRQHLELAALSVEVETVGTMARYEVEHVFHNDTDQVLEGTFRFPLPHGAIVTGLAMEIEGALMEGEILERERARKIYEEIVDSMRDPALLEWEAGQMFKLRVFPIAAGERKRVVMRYMAPLVHDAGGELVARIPTATPGMQSTIPALSVSVDGRAIERPAGLSASDNFSVAVDVDALPAYVVERQGEHSYLAARLELDWGAVPKPAAPAESDESDESARVASRRTIIVVDSSRSALESWPLAQDSVAALLDSLGADEPFMLVAADLSAQLFGEGFVVNSASSRADALAFLSAIEPDGASDLSAALAAVASQLDAEPIDAERGATDRVIYLGDGTPTWGTTDEQALAQEVRAGLAGIPVYALSLGKRESRTTLEALTGATGGRTLRPRSVEQVRAFASFLDQAPSLRALVEVEILLPDHAQAHAPASTTWFEGEQPVVHFRVAGDQSIPSEITVRGRVDGERVEQVVRLGRPAPLAGVRQQWVARELAQTKDKAAAVALSVEHSVLSKHTALLVLESEEAYERYEIERRHGPSAQADQDGDPEISGRSLDAEGSPFLGPGDLQPGDPEIHIPAPRDAVSVEVLFPFGETKTARWEDELGEWTLRFLVDDDVEPGTYEVLARVTHADGRVELITLEYTIDVAAPQLRLELRARDDGAYDVYAHQVLTEADAARERAEGLRGEQREEASTLDARRVELIMPDGQTLTLRQGLAGHFVRRWEPRAAVSWPATVTAVVADRALNSRRVELSLEGPR